MAEILLRRTLTGFEPADPAADAFAKSCEVGRVVKAKVSKPRNERHHRLFFALLNLVHENLPEDAAARYPTTEKLLDALKVLTGHAEFVWLPDGTQVVRPKSIAFHRMDQAEFEAFFERCCALIAKYWLPGVTSEDLRREAESMLGMRRAARW